MHGDGGGGVVLLNDAVEDFSLRSTNPVEVASATPARAIEFNQPDPLLMMGK